MTTEQLYQGAIRRLEAAKIYLNNNEIKPLVVAKDEVLMQFQPLFAVKHLPHLTEEEFRSFLLFRNNKHWSSIHRQGPRMCRDIAQLRTALLQLRNEQEALVKRYNRAVQSVPGLGKAVATAYLHIVAPEQYGVWNRVAENSLQRLGLWPRVGRGASEGQYYSAINRLLLQLAATLHVDLWTLDALWWVIDDNEGNQ